MRIGPEAARRLDRYLRGGSRHELAYRPELWLGVNGRGQVRLHGTGSGTTSSRAWLARGSRGQLVKLNCWVSPQMLTRYGASGRGARARRGYDRRYGRPWSPHAPAEGGVQNRSI